MKLSVITLSWDNLDYTKAFVKSIRQNTSLPYELIIIDNGSETETQKWVEKNSDCSLIFFENQGFSKGFNETASGKEAKAFRRPENQKDSKCFGTIPTLSLFEAENSAPEISCKRGSSKTGLRSCCN